MSLGDLRTGSTFLLRPATPSFASRNTSAAAVVR